MGVFLVSMVTLTCSTLKKPADCSTWHRDSTSLVLSTGSIPLLTISNRQSQASSLSSSMDIWLSSRFTNLKTQKQVRRDGQGSEIMYTTPLPVLVLTCHWRWGWGRSRTRRLRPPPSTDRWARGGTAGTSAGSGTRTPPGWGCSAPSCCLWSACSCESPAGIHAAKSSPKLQTLPMTHFLLGHVTTLP